MTFPTISAGTRANEAIGGYANFIAYANALAAGVDSVTTTAAGAALKANNLSDLTSASAARTALGLGTAAVANTGTGAANVILGNDARLTDTRTPTAASIVDAMIATTLSPSKITGTAAILGANTFTAQQFIDGSSDQIQQRIQGHSTQTSNLTTWESSAGAVLAAITGAGRFVSPNGTQWYDQSNCALILAKGDRIDFLTFDGGSTLAQIAGNGTGIQANFGLTAIANGAAVKPLVVKGAASQAANLQEWQNSSSSVLASISAAGAAAFGGSVTITATNGSFISQGVSGQWTGLDLKTGTSNRWKINRNGAAESGSNAGSNFEIYAYMDDGSTSITPLSITRATGVATFLNQVKVGASTTTRSSLNIPHGSAPTSPANGDMWTTTAGLYVHINGSTVGPLS